MSKTASKGAQNGSHCPGNERCGVDSPLVLVPFVPKFTDDNAYIGTIVVVTKGRRSLAMKTGEVFGVSCNGIANSMRNVGARIVQYQLTEAQLGLSLNDQSCFLSISRHRP
jgi:hypothetical protein